MSDEINLEDVRRRDAEFRATELGKAFVRFETAHSLLWQACATENVSPKRLQAHQDNSDKHRTALLALIASKDAEIEGLKKQNAWLEARHNEIDEENTQLVARISSIASTEREECLSDDDMCRLSIVFNRHGNIGFEQDRRINEWLKQQIKAIRSRPSPVRDGDLGDPRKGGEDGPPVNAQVARALGWTVWDVDGKWYREAPSTHGHILVGPVPDYVAMLMKDNAPPPQASTASGPQTNPTNQDRGEG